MTTRYSLGLMDVDVHRDAAHRPFYDSRGQAKLYNIPYNLSTNDTVLGRLDTAVPMYPVPYVASLTQRAFVNPEYVYGGTDPPLSPVHWNSGTNLFCTRAPLWARTAPKHVLATLCTGRPQRFGRV